MPFNIIKSQAGGIKGFRVRNEKTGEYLSKHAIPLKTADAQRKAVIMNEIKRGNVKNMKNGGLVEIPIGYEEFAKKVLKGGDVVPTVLMGGEIVIPTKHAKKVARFLKQERIKLPGL